MLAGCPVVVVAPQVTRNITFMVFAAVVFTAVSHRIFIVEAYHFLFELVWVLDGPL